MRFLKVCFDVGGPYAQRMGDLLRILVPGVAVGILVCLLASRLIGSVLYGVRPLDPASFAAALVIVDPAIVLREEV